MFTVRGVVLSATPRWQQLLGQSEEELEGRTADELVVAEDRDPLRDALATFARPSAPPMTLELRFLGPADGEPFTAQVRLKAIRVRQGRTVLVSATVAREVTGAELPPHVVVDAWHRRQVVLWRQPIRDVETLEIVREELLVRLELPTGEIAPAARFIGVLERLGLLGELDGWVLASAMELTAAPVRAGRSLEVNLAPSAVAERAALLATARGTLARVGPLHGELVVSLPGRLLGEDVEGLLELTSGLVGCGLRVAVDGVRGTTAELDTLALVPVDVVKLAPEVCRDPWLLRSTLRFVHAHGALAVGERVQDERTLDLLRTHGADEVQGFHVGRPGGP